jgi:hypothetical protein
MKRTSILILAVLVLSVFVTADHNFMLTVNGNYFFEGDSHYKDFYGKSRIFPEGKLAVRLFGNFYLWGSYGYMYTSSTYSSWSSKAVFNADLETESTLKKYIVSGGLGFYAGYLRPGEFGLRMEVGACRITNKVRTISNYIDSNDTFSDEEREESGIGFRTNLGVTYGLFKGVYAEAIGGYIYAKDKVEENSITLGGFRLSLGLGVTF